MKKTIAVLLSVCMLAFAGCSSDNSGELGSGSGSGDTSSSVKSYNIEEAYQAVADAYGEDFIPSMDIDEAQLKDVYGINMENVDSFKAQGPMISAHVDTLIAIKAKEGMGEEIKGQLFDYRDKLLDDTMQYPMNMPKIEASDVVAYQGDYVFFIMLGAINDTETDEEALVKYYEEETKRGIDALDNFFQ